MKEIDQDLLFSVIVPVYNNRCYLKRCIDSILGQTYDHYEVIVVDDGSIDGSYEFLMEHYSTFPNIKILKKENSGVSDTRNLALEYVTGDWVTFLDSDDYLDSEILQYAFDTISKYDIDFLGFNLCLVDERGRFLSNDLYDHMQDMQLLSQDQVHNYIASCVSISNFNKKICHGKYGNSRCIGGKFYKFDLIQNNRIRFSSNLITFEDGIFNLFYYSVCKNMFLSNRKLYYYFQNLSSATHKKDFYSTYQNFLNIDEIFQKSFPTIDADVLLLFYDESLHMLLHVIAMNSSFDKSAFAKLHEFVLDHIELCSIKHSSLRRWFYKRIVKKQYLLVYLFYKFKFILKNIVS